MKNFLINVEYDDAFHSWQACYADGLTIQLAADTFEDAVLEADMIEPYEYQS